MQEVYCKSDKDNVVYNHRCFEWENWTNVEIIEFRVLLFKEISRLCHDSITGRLEYIAVTKLILLVNDEQSMLFSYGREPC